MQLHLLEGATTRRYTRLPNRLLGHTCLCMISSRDIVTRLLGHAGVEVGGNRPWDVIVNDDRFYGRVLREGSLGAGESYMDSWWDCGAIDELTARVLSANLFARLSRPTSLLLAISAQRCLNRQRGRRSDEVALRHYDLGSEMFESMLGQTMNYSCAYWLRANDLDAAQRDKMDLICRKLHLLPGLKVLDIGCGFGGFARYAAQRYGCSVTGITNSAEQHAYALRLCRDLPVQVLLMDYCDPQLRRLGKFDRIVSVGMLEHVGRKNYGTFVNLCCDLVGEQGLMLLHSIGRTVDTPIDLWVDRYIFPNSYLPTMADISKAVHGRMVMEDWQNFGADYDLTLLAWHARFEVWANERAGEIDKRFYRMWRYYLLTFAGAFRIRKRLQLWQIVLSKRGVPGGYMSIR
jgi:cyclopropane-fatty-acyl-phospholipid synthase